MLAICAASLSFACKELPKPANETSPSAEPVVGLWRSESSIEPTTYRFLADGTLDYLPDDGNPADGLWERVPGDVYELEYENPVLPGPWQARSADSPPAPVGNATWVLVPDAAQYFTHGKDVDRSEWLPPITVLEDTMVFSHGDYYETFHRVEESAATE